MALTPRQQSFCWEYIQDEIPDPVAAYRRAGYDVRTDLSARSAASRLLSDVNIQAEIKRLRERASVRAELSAAAVLREIGRVALSDARKLFRDDGSLKPPNEWDDETAAAVASVEVEEIWAGRGEDRKQIGVTRKVKLWDKGRALELAAEHLGITKKPDLEAILVFFPPADAAALRVIIAAGDLAQSGRLNPVPAIPGVRDEAPRPEGGESTVSDLPG